MTSKEAFERVKDYLNDEPEIVEIHEYLDRFAFILIPAEGEGDSFGGDMLLVDKKSGDVVTRGDSDYDPRQPWVPVELDDEDHQEAIDILLGDWDDEEEEENE